MPVPNKGETEKQFINRCIPIVVSEGKELKQAVAVCYKIWEDNKK